MNIKTVKQRLWIEPKDEQEEASRFAVAFEQGRNQQRSSGGGASKVIAEPVCTIKESKDFVWIGICAKWPINV